MILGKLKDLSKYKNINKNLDIAIDYILNNDLNKLKEGTTSICEEKVFVNRFSYFGVEKEECFLEGHKRYIDIHILLNGAEMVAYNDVSNLVPVTEYDEKADFIKYEGKDNMCCNLDKEMFWIVFPEDIHMTKIKVNNDKIEKLVFKVLA